MKCVRNHADARADEEEIFPYHRRPNAIARAIGLAVSVFF